MTLRVALLFILAAVGCSDSPTASEPSLPRRAFPPFAGTLWISPDIITPADPTTFVALTPDGIGSREMWDRRVEAWIEVDAHLFTAAYDDSLMIEVQVNPEFDSTTAEREASFYAEAMGRVPRALREGVQVMWIHRGDENFSGWHPFVLIHTDYGNELKRNGFIEEILVHEAAHAALDEEHADASGWRLAQAADPTFVSTYAMEHPDREDIAETFPVWMTLRYLSDRIPTNMTNAIRNSIPHRLQYFDGQSFDMYPITPRP